MSQNLPYFTRLVVSKTLTTDTRDARFPRDLADALAVLSTPEKKCIGGPE
jgi:hypothetical protein